MAKQASHHIINAVIGTFLIAALAGIVSLFFWKVPNLKKKLATQEKLIKDVKESCSSMIQHARTFHDEELQDKLISSKDKGEIEELPKRTKTLEMEEVGTEVIEPGKTVPKEPIGKASEQTVPAEDFIEEHQIKEEFAKETPIESPVKDESLAEGRGKGFEAEIVEPEKYISEAPVSEEGIRELPEKGIIAEEEKQVLPVVGQTKVVHKVTSNDNLFNLARKYYGDETKWEKIYEANKDKMSSPDVLQVGQELLIPDATVLEEKNKWQVNRTPSEKKLDKEIFTTPGTHTVRPGDTLYKLAKTYYGDPSMWTKIYDANEDTLESKRFLKVGQILIIPEERTSVNTKEKERGLEKELEGSKKE